MRALWCVFALASAAAGAAPPHLSLELYRADLHPVLRLLADVGHTNLVVDDEVKGAVTLKLHDVSWAAALDAVLASLSLGQEHLGDVTRIARLDRLANEARMRATLAEARRTSGTLSTRIIPVRYARAEDLVPLVRALLSERGSVTYDARANLLIVSDVE
jgi:type IV pilus assembly protein PilQ